MESNEDRDIHEFVQWFDELVEKPGFFTPALKKLADETFEQENFTLLVLHGHLLVEKALNHLLEQKSVPNVLVEGDAGLTFKQKYDTVIALQPEFASLRKIFKVLNRLRNTIAHELVEPGECVRSAYLYAFDSKKGHKQASSFALIPRSFAMWLVIGILNTLGATDTLSEE